VTSVNPDESEANALRGAREKLETAAGLVSKVAAGGPFYGPHVQTPLIALVDAYIAARDADSLLVQHYSSPAGKAASDEMTAGAVAAGLRKAIMYHDSDGAAPRDLLDGVAAGLSHIAAKLPGASSSQPGPVRPAQVSAGVALAFPEPNPLGGGAQGGQLRLHHQPTREHFASQPHSLGRSPHFRGGPTPTA
jgi:hypothetical protein